MSFESSPWFFDVAITILCLFHRREAFQFFEPVGDQ
jgi:hypothetical protein